MGWFPSQYGDMFTKYINKACDGHAITMLAACYLPGHNFLSLSNLRQSLQEFWPDIFS